MAPEEQYARFFRLSTEAMCIADPFGCFEHCNPALVQMTGYTEDELISRPFLDFVVPEDRQRTADEMVLQVTTRSSLGFENRYRRKDGTIIHLSWTAYYDKTTGHTYATARDITERKQSQESLRRSEESQRLLVQHLPVGVVVHGADGQVILANEQASEVLGLTIDQMLGQALTPPSWHLLRSDGTRLPVEEYPVTQVLAQRGPLNQLELGVKVPGQDQVTWAVVNAFPEVDSQGEVQRVVVAFQDITKRKRAEEALRQSETQLRAIVENSRDAIGVSLVGIHVTVNPAYAAMFGFDSPEELIGTSILELIAPESQETVLGYIRARAAHEQVPAAYEVMARRRDGSHFTMEVHASAYELGGQTYTLVILRDITERKHLEEQLRQKQKMEAIGELSGGVAHDFNNILAAIMLHIDLLNERPDLDEEIRQSLKDFRYESERAAALTRQLLMFSRRSVMRVKPLDVNEVVAQLLKMLRRLLGEPIEVHFHPRVVPAVEGDAGMLEQVLINLAVNARDAMPGGGRLTVATEEIELSEDEARRNPQARAGRFVCLSVADGGAGMDEATQIRIFEPFFTTKELGKGTGLGLATVYGIAAQHRGWVEVESAPGEGSVFRVFLPASSSPVEEGFTEEEAPLRGHETILLVEDEPGVRDTMARALGLLGYRVLQADCGSKALEVWGEHQAEVELLLSDVIMPYGMTGLELAERLRAQEPGLKVILMSGYSSLQLSNLPGDIHYLAKPCRIGALSRVLRACLDPARAC